jgi:CPA1 family monovalent cation:H+ antiporter
MTVARRYDQAPARDRIHAYAVWDTVVFVLNVLAFLFVGLQARAIVQTLGAAELRHAITFAALVFATVIVVRIAWVMLYNRLAQPLYRWLGYGAGPTLKQSIVASWCGMRGMVTLAAALALPEAFPQRGLVVLSALAVVLGTLILQGITLEPLIRLLRFPADTTQDEDLERARLALASIAHAELDKHDSDAANLLREELRLQRIADQGSAQEPDSAVDALRLATIRTQRSALWRMLRDGTIGDETFRALERELDLSEIAAARREVFDLVDG